MGHGIDYSQLADARGLRIAIVAARWNDFVVEPMLAQAQLALTQMGAEFLVVRVPGAFELPVAAARVAPTVDAVICLGAVIRGDTPHFDYVAGQAAHGIQQVAVQSGVPVLFGVLTTDNRAQAVERADPSQGNKGREFAQSAVETALALRPFARTHPVTRSAHV